MYSHKRGAHMRSRTAPFRGSEVAARAEALQKAVKWVKCQRQRRRLDKWTEKFAVEGMELKVLPTGAAGGSGGESNVVGFQDQSVGPPTSPPHGGELPKVDPGSQGEDEEAVAAAVQLTSEQQGQAVRDRFTEDPKQQRLAKAALEKAAGA